MEENIIIKISLKNYIGYNFVNINFSRLTSSLS